jgi:hypothetical protein
MLDDDDKPHVIALAHQLNQKLDENDDGKL